MKMTGKYMKKIDIEIDQIKKTIKKHGWDKAENIIMYCSWQSWKNYEFVKTVLQNEKLIKYAPPSFYKNKYLFIKLIKNDANFFYLIHNKQLGKDLEIRRIALAKDPTLKNIMPYSYLEGLNPFEKANLLHEANQEEQRERQLKSDAIKICIAGNIPLYGTKKLAKRILENQGFKIVPNVTKKCALLLKGKLSWRYDYADKLNEQTWRNKTQRSEPLNVSKAKKFNVPILDLGYEKLYGGAGSTFELVHRIKEALKPKRLNFKK